MAPARPFAAVQAGDPIRYPIKMGTGAIGWPLVGALQPERGPSWLFLQIIVLRKSRPEPPIAVVKMVWRVRLVSCE